MWALFPQPSQALLSSAKLLALIASWWVGRGHLSVGQVGLLSPKDPCAVLKAS